MNGARVFGISLIAVGLAAIASAAPPAERPDLKFLHFQAWMLGSQLETRDGQINVEYIPAGQSVYDWREMFTWQYLPDRSGQSALRPREFMDAHRHLRMRLNPSTEWTVISQRHHCVTYEYQVDDEPMLGHYHEIIRIVRGENGLHVFHYATKMIDLSSHDRSAWLGRLGRIEFQD